MAAKRVFMVTCMAVLVLSFFTGCATFPSNNLQTVEKFQTLPEGTKKPTIGYSFSSGIDFMGKLEHQENVRAQLEKELTDVMSESGYFASLSPGNQGDLRMQVRLVNSGTPLAMIPAFITGLSLYTIPSWVTDNYDITAKVTDHDGKEHTYQLTDSITTVQWLPMIFVAPFKNPINVPQEVRRNIWKNLILNMQKEGILSRQKNAGPISKINIKFEWIYAA